MAVIEASLTVGANGETDHLGEAVLRNFSREFRGRFALTWIRGFIFGLLTLGLLPVISMGRKLRHCTQFERQQWMNLAQWLRTRNATQEAEDLGALAGRLRVRGGLYTVAVLCAVAALLAGPLRMDQIMRHAYGDFRAHSFQAWEVWNLGLAIAYVLCVAQVVLHRGDVERLVEKFNSIAIKHGLNEVEMPCGGLTKRAGLGWVIVGLVLFTTGALWGVLFAVAGAAQWSYVNGTSRSLRQEIAQRVGKLMAMNKPAVASVHDERVHRARCPRDTCQAALPADADFCPRCGMPARGAM